MRFTLFILCITFSSFQLKAQENDSSFEYGVKYGLLLSELKGTETLKSLRTSFNVGLVSEIKINSRFAIQSELLYARQGSSDRGNIQGSFFENRINLDYFNLPILVKYYLKQGLAIELGPQFGYLVDAKYISKQAENSFVRSIDDNFEEFDASLAAGVSYKTDWGFLVGLRYSLGLTDINNEFDLESNSLQNATFQLYFGYLLN
jgi:hypothetical protein